MRDKCGHLFNGGTGTKRRMPFSAGRRVPDSVEGCHTDGLDIADLGPLKA